jgi:hypothetical protein
MSTMRMRLGQAAVSVAIVATVPYLVLKSMWLSGSTIGMTSGAGAAEMSGTRFVVGNVITVLLVLAAVMFVIAVTRPWARHVPAWLVFVLSAGATGLLAPIVLGLPLGSGIQLAVEGHVESADDTGLDTWVYGVVYGGFGLLAVAMAVVVAAYVHDRWGDLLERPPRRPSTPASLAGGLALLPFGTAMIWWGMVGPGTTGPQGMDSSAQRTVLIVTGALSIGAFAVPFVAEHARAWPRSAWLVTWTGSCICAVQAPAQILLAQDADVRPGVALIALWATPGSCIYGLATLRQHLSLVRSAGAARHGGATATPDSG